MSSLLQSRVQARNNVRVMGQGSTTLFFSHGYGCDQNMWRLLEPHFSSRYRIVLYDLVGAGQSDASAYEPDKYSTLEGYARDLIEIVDAFAQGASVLVGHSVSSMISLLADLASPRTIDAQIMIGPSPCYINEGDYTGGFSRPDIDSLLETLDNNYLGWASSMAPSIMGAPTQPELGQELTNSFCRTDPEIAKRFAHVTFLSDLRSKLPELATPTLLLQCHDDLIAPVAVGEYMHRVLPTSTLELIQNVGHCPHVSAPDATSAAMDTFLKKMKL